MASPKKPGPRKAVRYSRMRFTTGQLLKAPTIVRMRARTSQLMRAITHRKRKWGKRVGIVGSIALAVFLAREGNRQYDYRVWQNRVEFANREFLKAEPVFVQWVGQNADRLHEELLKKHESGGYLTWKGKDVRQVELADPRGVEFAKRMDQIRKGNLMIGQRWIEEELASNERSRKYLEKTSNPNKGWMMEALHERRSALSEALVEVNRYSTMYGPGRDAGNPEIQQAIQKTIDILSHLRANSYGIGNIQEVLTEWKYRGFFDANGPEHFFTSYHVHANPEQARPPSPADNLASKNGTPLLTFSVSPKEFTVWQSLHGNSRMVYSKKYLVRVPEVKKPVRKVPQQREKRR